MLGNYERRRFVEGERLWLGHYRNLTNVLHWHMEWEIIHVAQGCAQVCIGGDRFFAQEGDTFLCAGEQMHYIISQPGARVDILIADAAISPSTADYRLFSPLISPRIEVADRLRQIERLRRENGFLYREAMEHVWQGLMLDIFRTLPIRKKNESSSAFRDLLDYIHQQMDRITFSDAVRYIGYSASHFSRIFKDLSGMSFSDYLNVIRVEQFISRMRENPQATVTELAHGCGFSTVRNFNRVFKLVTGYTPRTLPKEFIVDRGLRMSGQGFDPTDEQSVLIGGE